MGAMDQIDAVAEVQDILSTTDHVVIDFTAAWCGPCKMLTPKMEVLAETCAREQKPIRFIKVEVNDTNTAFVTSQGIASVPTIKFYKNGEALEALTVVGPNFKKTEESVKKLLNE